MQQFVTHHSHCTNLRANPIIELQGCSAITLLKNQKSTFETIHQESLSALRDRHSGAHSVRHIRHNSLVSDANLKWGAPNTAQKEQTSNRNVEHRTLYGYCEIYCSKRGPHTQNNRSNANNKMFARIYRLPISIRDICATTQETYI